MKVVIFATLLGLMPVTQALAAPPHSKQNAALIAEGRHLVILGGCNFCHTAGWTDTLGKVPEKDWLEGSPVGFYGPWGTSYPVNLRLFIPLLPESAWVQYARVMQPKPPMPWFDVNQFTDRELKAIYVFVKYLGPGGKPAPADLPPGAQPRTPYINFAVVNPEHKAHH